MALEQEKRYTYADLLAFDDNVRYELYDGELVALAAPSSIHQQISFQLSGQLYAYLLGKKCKAFYAPFDVRLFEQKGDEPRDVDDVKQPDICVICDESKLDERGCKGAPDLIIEILSPATARADRIEKFNLYQKAGVKEYWIVDPSAKVVSVYSLEDGRYHAAVVYPESSVVPVGVLEDCKIDLSTVFPDS